MELGLTQDTRRPVETATMVEAARRAGFTALGMVSGRVDAEARAAFDAAALDCHELLGLQVSDDADATLASAERLADDAAVMRASWVLATFRSRPSDGVLGTVARCAALFADAGAGLAVEFSPLSPVATIRDGLDVMAAAGEGRAGLVIDSWNFCLGACDWEELQLVPLDAIAYVQFADALAPLGAVDMVEAMTRRALPGHGVLDLDRFASTLRGRGWDGVVSLQVLSDELRALAIDDYARRVHDSAVRYWV